MPLKLLFVADNPKSEEIIQPLFETISDKDCQVLKLATDINVVSEEEVVVNSIEEYLMSEASRDFNNDTIVIYGIGFEHEASLVIPTKLHNNRCIAVHDLPYINASHIVDRDYRKAYKIIVPDNNMGVHINNYLKRNVSVCLNDSTNNSTDNVIKYFKELVVNHTSKT